MRAPRGERPSAVRERILAAALHCLVTYGYAGTTTVAVQKQARVSRGSLLHYYPRREDLLVAAAQHARDLWLDEIERRFNELVRLVPNGRLRLEAAVRLRWSSYHNQVHDAFAELWTASRYNKELRDAVLEHERLASERVRNADARLFGPYAQHPNYDYVLTLLHTSMRGRAEAYALVERDWAQDPMIDRWIRLTVSMLVDSDDPDGKA